MVDIICTICGQKQQIKKLFPAARRKNIHLKIVKCERCGLVFPTSVFSQEELLKVSNGESREPKDREKYLTRVYFDLIKKIEKNLPKQPRVLEVGHNNGFFLNALRDLKFSNDVFNMDTFSPNIFPENNFDLILCFHTLDNMLNPKEFIKGAYAMLRDNGYIIIVVDDVEGLFVKMFKERARVFNSKHIYLFNKKTLRRIFVEKGFNIIEISDLIDNFTLNYWLKISDFSKTIKKYMKKIFNLLDISESEVPIPAGNIFLIGKKEISNDQNI